MAETITFRTILIKVLAIAGFIVTIGLIVWGLVLGFRHAPALVTSLASITHKVQNYKPVTELSITPAKDVVNSAESFEITWTDTHTEGEYQFKFGCVKGVDLEVRNAEGTLTPMACTDTLTLPGTVHGLFLSLTSDELRFTDVPLTVIFNDTVKKTSLEGTQKITVVNASVPVAQVKEGTTTPNIAGQPKTDTAGVAKTTTSTAPATTTVAKPTTPTITASHPSTYGSSDLKLTMYGSGVIRNGIFSYTTAYDPAENVALRFDVKNVGTKTSNPWTFTMKLPNGEYYASPLQKVLNPGDHIEFTLGFYVDESMSLATLTGTVHVKDDTHTANNTASWSVLVEK